MTLPHKVTQFSSKKNNPAPHKKTRVPSKINCSKKKTHTKTRPSQKKELTQGSIRSKTSSTKSHNTSKKSHALNQHNKQCLTQKKAPKKSYMKIKYHIIQFFCLKKGGSKKTPLKKIANKKSLQKFQKKGVPIRCRAPKFFKAKKGSCSKKNIP